MPHLGDYISPELRYPVEMKVGQTLKLAAVLVLFGASSMAAADTVTVTPAGPFGLGRVVSSSAVTTFTISTAGAVSQSPAAPPGARRLTTGTVTVATINVTCTACNGNAASKLVTVTVAATASGARAKFSNFTRAGSATGATVGSNTSGLPLVFTLQFTSNGTQTASIGLTASIQVLTTGTTGTISLPFTVSTSRP